ncbi:MAG: MerR family transcriptional regulator [Haloechinothrix sp.]
MPESLPSGGVRSRGCVPRIGAAGSRRSSGRHRRYSAADVERLYRIRLLRRLGLPLAGIALAPSLSRSSALLANRCGRTRWSA